MGGGEVGTTKSPNFLNEVERTVLMQLLQVTKYLSDNYFFNIKSVEIVFYAWFTFSSRQHETIQERECEGYICLVFHTLDLFSSHLEALRDMSVNYSPVKGNKSMSRMSCFVIDDSRTRVPMSTFVRTSSCSHLTKSLDKFPKRECKPGIKPLSEARKLL